MRSPVILLIFVLTWAFLIPGCARLPTTHYYVLEPQGKVAEQSPRSAHQNGLVIGVEAFLVDPPYDQDRIVYRVGEDSPEVGFYAYHRWAAPLSRMLPPIVAAQFRGTTGVSSIGPIASGRDYAAFLEGRVLELEQIDVSEGQRVRVRLELTLRLEDGTALFSETLTAETVTRTRKVSEVVEQMSTALSQALNEAREGFQRALQQ